MRRRLVLVTLASVVMLPALFVAITYLQVWRASNTDDARPADAIVVLGAAQYDGRPSPVLEARLQQALDLYERGLAPLIVTTGGKQPGDRFTEAFAEFRWLRNRGVPEEAILLVNVGVNTYEQLAATALVLDQRGLGEDVLLVSDPYHHLRATEIARELGLRAGFSPADVTVTGRQLVRETAGVALGRVIGFRRVANLAA